MKPLDHLRHATIDLTETIGHWPRAQHNLYELQAGYPTGHTSTARIDTGDPPPDPCRTALARIDHNLANLVLHVTAHTGLRHRQPADRGLALRHAHRLVHLLVADLEQLGKRYQPKSDTYRDIHHATRTIHAITVRWSFGTHRGDPSKDARTHPDEWCRSCLRLQRWTPPAVGRYATLCRKCGEYAGAHHGALPPEWLLAKERWTANDIARAERKGTAA